MLVSARRTLGKRLWDVYRFGLNPQSVLRRMRPGAAPRVLCIAVPKAGTHLLERLLCLHPELYRKVVPTLNPGNLERWGGLDRVLGRLRPGQILISHLPYESVHHSAIRDNAALPIFMVRDPRAILISNVHYIVDQIDHRWHDLFMEQPDFQSRAILTLRGDNQAGFIPFASRLLRYTEWFDSEALTLRFEHLVDQGSRAESIQGVFTYLGLAADAGLIDSIGRHLVSPVSPTFRRGVVGGWRDEFTAELAAEFAQTCPGLLDTFGYDQGQ